MAKSNQRKHFGIHVITQACGHGLYLGWLSVAGFVASLSSKIPEFVAIFIGMLGVGFFLAKKVFKVI